MRCQNLILKGWHMTVHQKQVFFKELTCRAHYSHQQNSYPLLSARKLWHTNHLYLKPSDIMPSEDVWRLAGTKVYPNDFRVTYMI